MEKKTKKTEKNVSKKTEEKTELVSAGTRGRTFEGTVVSKFPTRVTIEFERTVYIRKYERYAKKKTRIHARLPSNLDAEIGDYIKVQECRPLSKIIHFMVLGKVSKEKKQ